MIEDERLIIWGAFRYYLGRQTAATHGMIEWLINHAELLPTWDIRKMAEEIDEAIEEGRAGNERIDVPEWNKLLILLRALGREE